METPIREYYCLDCIGIKENDLCRACFKEKYQPVKETVENEIINVIQNEMINEIENEQENAVVDTVETESNKGDIDNLIKLSQTRPPLMDNGLCMMCQDLNNVCKYYNAIKILEWVIDTKKYKIERLEAEILVTAELLRSDNPIIDVSFVDASIVNQSNEGDMENLMELSKLDPPMFNGLCIECEDFQGGNICQNAKANRILQWVEDTYRYRKEREIEELYVTWNVLPFEILNYDDDYTIDNMNDIDE